MSLSASLFNALTGMSASTKAAELVSSNVANAGTDGYGRRELELAVNDLGGTSAGVRIVGVRRDVDQVVVQDRRLAQATLGQDATLSDFQARLEDIVGLPGEDGSLTGSVDAFEAALTSAAAHPDSEIRLQAVADTANDLTAHLRGASTAVQDQRSAADQKIGQQVVLLNDSLARVETLNTDIREALARGGDATALMDQRQLVIDAIAGIVPIKQVARDNGVLSLFTETGAVLVDGRASQFGFSTAGVIVPEMTLASGALSGLTLNGRAVSTGGAASLVAGGSLAALFEIRDVAAVGAQAKLDAIARDLIARYQAADVDPSRGGGGRSLFTDTQAQFDSVNELGVAGRIALINRVDPAQGGELWRLRAGIYALTPGDVGDTVLLSQFAGVIAEERPAGSGGFLGLNRSFSALTAEFASEISAARLRAEEHQVQSNAHHEGLRLQELEGGVDTDQEMEKLLQIEQAYAANARVIQTVGAMIDRLMDI